MKKIAKYILVPFLFLLFAHQAFAQYDEDVFFFRGRQALAEGRYATAIENFNILERLDTLDHLTPFYRGIAKFNLGDVRGAQKDFNRSIYLNPIFTAGYHYRGITESRFGEYEKALEDIQKAITLRPGFEGLYFSRGVTYFLSQQFDKAIEDFDKYIRRQPKDPSAFINRGTSHMFLGDTLQAIKDYETAIKLDRFEPESYVRRGRLYAQQGKYDLAIEDMDQAIRLDTTNTFAYFNRAIMFFDTKDYNAAMKDLNRVLRDEPGNALTLYNRSLISAQIGNYNDALQDMDRVININPKNVLAYFNRASFFIQMERWQDALEDYDKAIELYPDFAKAYMNRSYVESMLGMVKESKKDYETAQKKIREYHAKNNENASSFADTTKKYSSLLSLDAEFAKKDFNDELLQHRDVDIRLKPLYRFALSEEKDLSVNNLSRKYENSLISRMIAKSPVAMKVVATDSVMVSQMQAVKDLIWSSETPISENQRNFLKALYEVADRQFNSALNYYTRAIDGTDESGLSDKYEELYRAFYYLNRGVLRADMIEFISSIENNVQILTMDEKGTSRARVRDQVYRNYDYSEAIEDMEAAAGIVDDIPYIYFNLGNLYCLSSKLVESIDNYSKAIQLYPYMGDAFFNRGLVLIFLKDKEKGCIDLSRAGELGIEDAYSVINKYCKEEEE